MELDRILAISVEELEKIMREVENHKKLGITKIYMPINSKNNYIFKVKNDL